MSYTLYGAAIFHSIFLKKYCNQKAKQWMCYFFLFLLKPQEN